MKSFNWLNSILFIMLLASFTACDPSSSSNEKVEEKVTSIEAKPTITKEYDMSKACHIVGADMSKVLVDTLGVVMYEFTMNPGDSVAWHEHPYHTLYVLEGGKAAVYFNGGEKQIMEFPTGYGMLGEPLGDAAVNIGDTPIKVLTHELYSLAP
ncbi:cupin domain-containing protein [Echinicola shivajiensis]|uniref:cupin domain-containing protein n=1 Tax=Echinicola shivajiensis TaxID=1035916 RepID=UPI001BFC4AFA|nr:cupin domain-containing protein [Echinicola shivajiensis]